MASLMSMDAYVIPVSGDGTTDIREAHQWLNGPYGNRTNFALIPCDGLHSRQIQTAMFYALQYEFGMAVVNGNFGPGARQGLKDDAPFAQGDVDGNHHFAQLFQGSLRFNGYTPPFSGTFDATTLRGPRRFNRSWNCQPMGRAITAPSARCWCRRGIRTARYMGSTLLSS